VSRLFLLVPILFLAGCSAFLVTESSDPYIKLTQASELLEIGRPIPSERIAKEALGIFIVEKDKYGESEANFFLGIFYKTKSGWANVATEDYLNKAINKLTLAEKGYISLGENIQASKVAFELGQSYRGKERTDITCQYYEKSIELYKTGKGEHKEFSFNLAFKSPLELIQVHIEHVCPKNA